MAAQNRPSLWSVAKAILAVFFALGFGWPSALKIIEIIGHIFNVEGLIGFVSWATDPKGNWFTRLMNHVVSQVSGLVYLAFFAFIWVALAVIIYFERRSKAPTYAASIGAPLPPNLSPIRKAIEPAIASGGRPAIAPDYSDVLSAESSDDLLRGAMEEAALAGMKRQLKQDALTLARGLRGFLKMRHDRKPPPASGWAQDFEWQGGHELQTLNIFRDEWVPKINELENRFAAAGVQASLVRIPQWRSDHPHGDSWESIKALEENADRL